MQDWKVWIKDPVRMLQWFMLCRHGGVLLSSVVIARLLPLSEVGVFEMLMLCGYLLTFFWSEAMLKGFLAVEYESEWPHPGISFFWLYIAIGILIMGFLVAGQSFLLPVLVDQKDLQGLLLFAFYQVFILPLWITPFIGLGRSGMLFPLALFVLFGPALASLAGLLFLPGLHGVLAGLLGYAILGIVCILVIHKPFRDLRIRALWSLMWPVTWPLMLYSLSTGLARSFDAWLVARYFDTTVFAVFRYGAREFPVVVAVAAGLSTAMIPRLRTMEALSELRVRSIRLMHLCYPGVMVLMLCSTPLFVAIYGPEFRNSAYIFNIYLLLTLTQLIFPQSVVLARGGTRWLWYVSLAELTVNVVASLLLLSYFGLVGIAWGTLVAFIFEKILLLILVHKKYAIHFRDLMSFRIMMGYTFLLLLSFIVAAWIYGT